MADLLTVGGFPQLPGTFDSYKAQSIAVIGDQVSIIINNPFTGPFQGMEDAYFEQSLTLFADQNKSPHSDFPALTLSDQTTGQTYNLPLEQDSVSYNYGADRDTVVYLNFRTASPPFQGVLTGVNPCFASGTPIDGPSGPRAVEQLARGDIVTLSNGGTTCVVWIGHRRQHGGDVIRVRHGALGSRLPRRDLIVSEDHGLFLDGVLVPAGLLVDGQAIRRERHDTVVFWHVELERHGILLAEGAPAESYLDTGNRRQFGNCALSYDPVSAVQEPCAEMVFAGERLDAIRAGLRNRAASGEGRTTAGKLRAAVP